MLLVQTLSLLVTVAVVVEGSGHTSWLSSLVEFLEKSKQNGVLTQGSPVEFVKCDATFSCPNMFTCCKSSIGFYCCPSWMPCGTTPGSCRGSVAAMPLLSKDSAQRRKLPRGPQKSKQNEVLTQGSPPEFVKCDATFSCPDMFTCCKISIGFYCCPSGMSCGTTPLSCNGIVAATPLLSKDSAERLTYFNKELIVSKAPTETDRDAVQPTLEIGDQKTGQMTGDIQDRDGPASSADSDEAKLQYATQDKNGFCPSQQTVCRSPIGLRCCRFLRASCCMNGLHCCRAGSRCVNNQCISPSLATSATSDSETNLLEPTSSAAVFFFNQEVRVRTRPGIKAKTRFLAAKRTGSGFGTGIQTESGASSAGDGLVSFNVSTTCTQKQTCCKLASGDCGCCQYPNATCCQDRLHCCPNGYTCGQSSRTCLKNGIVLEWSLKHHAVKKER